jgi:SEC-C motif-containing protein
MAKRRSLCPCGGSLSYEDCCGRLHRGEAEAATAEQLMRSRFSAFAVGDAGYLLKSWHPATRPTSIDFPPDLRWRRLEILGAVDGGPSDRKGTVEFRAHYVQGGRAGELHEISRFVRQDGAWVYVEGKVG